MAQETQDLRNKTRRVKNHILTRYLALADRVDEGEVLKYSEQELYSNLTLTFARNVIPRSQEIGGDPDNQTPIPILNALPTDNGNQKDSVSLEENTSGTRRDISK